MTLELITELWKAFFYRPNTDTKCSQGQAALHKAAIRVLLEVGINPSELDNSQNIPLHLPCTKIHLNIAKMLIVFLANMNLGNSNAKTELLISQENNYFEIKTLFERGANTNKDISDTKTPIQIAETKAQEIIISN